MLDGSTWTWVRRFWLWWWRELAGCVPGRLVSLLLPPPPRLCIELTTATSEASPPTRDGQTLRLQAAADATDAELARLVARHGRGRRVRLELGPERILLRRLPVPYAVAAAVDDFLALEVPRLVPFAAADARYAWRRVGASPASGSLGLGSTPGQVEIEVAAVRRSLVEALATRAIAWGVAPARLEVGPAGAAGLDLLHPHRALDLGPLARTNLALAGLILVMTLVGVGGQLVGQHVTAGDLEARVATMRQALAGTQALRQELDAKLSEQRFLVEQKATWPVAGLVVAELAQLIPDHTWLEALIIEQGSVELRGLSGGVEELVRGLAASPIAADPVFRSPVTSEQNLQRFHITADLGAGAKAASQPAEPQ